MSQHNGNSGAYETANLIVDRLSSGIYRLGDRLPASRDLARELGIHRNTAAKAYRILEDLRLVTVRQGSGTYIVALPEQDQRQSIASQVDDGIVALTMKAFRLGITERDFRSHVDEEIKRVYQSAPKPIAFVECNNHDLRAATAELEALTQLRLDAVRLDALQANPAAFAGRYEIVLTSLFHITEVAAALAAYLPSSNVIGVHTQPDELAVSEIAHLQPGSRVGVIVSNAPGGRRNAAQIHSYVEADTIVLVAPSDEEITGLARRVDAVVCSRSRAEQVRSLQLDVPVIELSFHISRRSANLAVEAIGNATNTSACSS